MFIPVATDAQPCLPSGLPSLQLYQREAVGPTVSVLAVGDVGFSGRIRQHGQYDAFFQEIAPFLNSADLAFGNLETPLVESDGFFAGAVAAAPALQAAGFTHLNLANNHIYDYGQAGLLSSADALSAHNIELLGVAEGGTQAIQPPDLVTINGVRLGWLSFGRTLRPQAESGLQYWEYDPATIKASVEQAIAQCDTLIVSIHAGLMLLDHPDPGYRQLALELRELGAALVLFHHAHLLQGVEADESGRIICHCLGNFLWDYQEGHMPALFKVREQNEGAIFQFEFDRQGITKAAILPTYLDDNLHIHWATGKRGERIVQRLEKLSRELQTGYAFPYWRQRATYHLSFTSRLFWYHLRNRNWDLFLQLNQELLQGGIRIVRRALGLGGR